MPAVIQTPTPNFDSSVNFYARLGFRVTTTPKGTYALSSKSLKIEINSDRYSRVRLKLYATEWKHLLKKKVL